MAGMESLAEWVAREILPHEADLRGWLSRRAGRPPVDIEDIVQECYCLLSEITDPGAILSPRAYLFTVARNICLQQVRRARVVTITSVAEIDDLAVANDQPSPERVAAGRHELARVQKLIAALPERTRRIVELRKLHGLSQQETARRLGVSETIVENDASRGLRRVLRMLTQERDQADGRLPAKGNHARNRG